MAEGFVEEEKNRSYGGVLKYISADLPTANVTGGDHPP